MNTARLVGSVCALCIVLCAASSAAQEQTEGFALNRFDPAEAGSDWFALDSLDLRGHGRFAAGLTGDWAYKPLVLYDGEGEELSAVVEHQVFAHLGVGAMLWDRLRVAALLPVGIWTAGEGTTIAGVEYGMDEGVAVGDLRLGADVRLYGEYGEPFTTAVGFQVHTPTGNRDRFTSDGSVRLVPRWTAAGDVNVGDLGDFAYAAKLGANIRTLEENYADAALGTEIAFAAAMGFRLLERRLLVGPELWGATVVSDSGDGFFTKQSTPFELLFGGHYFLDNGMSFGLGVGPGLTRGLGAPLVRALGRVGWSMPYEAEPSDRDRDGIIDDEDACPDVAGVATGDPQTHGCPPPSDRDGDSIVDVEDACPDVPGVATDDPATHGCPPPSDRDGDGIIDDEDACPDVAGVATGDPLTHGCPPPSDRDGDGIVDDKDACPDKAGVPNADPKKHGCPKAVVVGKQIKILERVEFDTAQATLRPESGSVLEAVLSVLNKHPEIKKVRVEGHTDNRGSRAYNRGLSQRRAAAVVGWLIKKGVDPSRLTAEGFGLDRPIDTNETSEGRQNNRRVEFHIVDNPGGIVDSSSRK